ncbi:MAG: Gfo/Idh/MocA family oxidoreductase [Pirellulales bacterium]
MKKVRCAVIGAGWWATTAHLPALQAHPDVELVAVQSLDENRVQQIAQDFGAGCALTNWQDVLAIDGLDAVVIASTPNLHFEQTAAALDRRLHVLLEKPMTFTADEAAKLVRMAQVKGLHLVMGYPFHYTRHANEAHRLISSGELGDVRMISILMVDECLGLYQGLPWSEIFGDGFTPDCEPRPYVEPGRRSYADPAIAGGGQIYSQVSHAAALVTFLTGRQAVEVFARFDNTGANVDVYNVVNVKLEGGAIVGICSTGASRKTKRTLPVTVYGTEGVIHLDLFDGTMLYQKMDGTSREYPQITNGELYPKDKPVENLIDLVLNRGTNRSPGILGLAAMKIVDGACRSVRQNSNVQVPWW